jgi:CRP/FNR family transcriptional regulator
MCTTPASTFFTAGTAHGCLGFISVVTGRLRVYTISSDGRELTLFRLSAGDHCLISASCAMDELSISTSLTAEVDTTYLLLPSDEMHDLVQQVPDVATYANSLMAQRLSQVMWLINQLLSDKLDVRIAALLLEESRLSGSRRIRITHEQIAHHLGSAREVITRILNYLADEGYVSLSRGMVTLDDVPRLKRLAANSSR